MEPGRRLGGEGVSTRNGKKKAHRVGLYIGRQLDDGGLAHGSKRGPVAA